MKNIVSLKENNYSVIGKRQTKLDGPLKTTGRSQFTDDIYLPGMLYGKIVRSPMARARIISIDSTKAERLPGVKAVITHKDFPGLMVGPDEELLCREFVNYIGDEVAAVAAVDRDTAQEAAELISVEYEKLGAVFSLDESLAERSPVIHKGLKNNYADEFDIDIGDVDKAFSESEHVRVGEYKLNHNHNCYAEHHVVIADHSLPGKLSIWTPNQSPLFVQKGLAGLLGLSVSDVRIFNLNTGGSFSSRGGPRNHHYIAALLSKQTSRPVKIFCTADEEFFMPRDSGEHKYTVKIGVMKDGKLKAIEVVSFFDCGAYWNPILTGVFRGFSNVLAMDYRFEAIRRRGKIVYTNNPPNMGHHGGEIRQLNFVAEAELDLIASDIGIDPLELRYKNAWETGATTIAGVYYGSCGLKECMEKVAKSSGWEKKQGKLPPYKGIGIGCGGIFSGGKSGMKDHDTGSAIIRIGEDGKVFLDIGFSDMGQGSHTTMAMIAAETLGIAAGDVTVIAGDTDLVPYDVTGSSQRGTFAVGNAVKAACLDAGKQLAEGAAKELGVAASELVFCDRKVFSRKEPAKCISFQSVVFSLLHSDEGRHVMGRGFYNSPTKSREIWVSSLAFSFGAQIAEVEVNPETGIIKLVRMTVAHDVGRVINPLGMEGQLDSQIFGGMGQILTEECIMEKGLILNPSPLDYRLSRPFEVPEVERIMVETNDPYGPFGAKEGGEGPIVCTVAIANAVSNAIGYPIREYPITPERVLHAIREKEKKQESKA
ncbi:MAG: xanthine dehydrogenase family protein molybdopterin-binding subunit [Pseudomonadota bacterium]